MANVLAYPTKRELGHMNWVELVSACARDRGNSDLWAEFLARYGLKIKQFVQGAWQLSLAQDAAAVLGELAPARPVPDDNREAGGKRLCRDEAVFRNDGRPMAGISGRDSKICGARRLAAPAGAEAHPSDTDCPPAGHRPAAADAGAEGLRTTEPGTGTSGARGEKSVRTNDSQPRE